VTVKIEKNRTLLSKYFYFQPMATQIDKTKAGEFSENDLR